VHSGLLSGPNGPVRGSYTESRHRGVGRTGALALVIVSGVVGLAAASASAGGERIYAPEMRAMIETVIAAALGSGVVVLAELFRRERHQRDLLLFAGLATIALVDLVSYVGPADLGLRASDWPTAAAPIGAVLAALCFGGAAMSPHGRLLSPQHAWGRRAAVATVIAWACAELLGRAITSVSPAGGNRVVVHSDSHVLIPIIVAAALLFAFAGGQLLSRSAGEKSSLATWFGSGVLLLAAGILDRLVLGPSAGGEITDVVILRLLGYLVISIGLLREVQHRQQQTAATLVRAEQQRLARALHDGLCQDLAFLAAHGSRIANVLGDDNPLAIASRRALATSRAALDQLAPPIDQGLGDAMRVLAAELSIRFQIFVVVEADDLHRAVSAADRDDIIQIAREAIVNAVKHGGARRVRLLVTDAPGHFLMKVEDDGSGIGPADERHDGFGITSMRERATSLGGVLSAQARAEGGTELRVVLP
jgi:signal transduction histidine kinase